MKRLALRLIRAYQRRISPNSPPSCRFYPTCSEYGAQAIEHYGVVHGGAKTAWRIARCNPMSAGGYDPPIPEKALQQPDALATIKTDTAANAAYDDRA